MPDNIKNRVVSVLILCGGIGSRLWPISNKEEPKQFLCIRNDLSLLQESFNRAKLITNKQFIYIITTEVYKERIHQELPDLLPDNILTEPSAKNTAAAILLSTLYIKKHIPDNSTLVIMPSDHIIDNDFLFIQTIKSAVTIVNEHASLCTIGIRPTYPSTDYGYIKMGESISLNDDTIIGYKVYGFKEKPDIHTAKDYIDRGYVWNSGMFVWRIKDFIEEASLHMKEDYIILSSTLKRYGNDVGKLIAAYSIVSGLSIDYALIEKARNIHCIRAMFSWNDLGGWKALAEYNRCRNIRQEDGMNNWIYSDNEDLEILTVGVSDMLLVKYKNKLIIVPKDKINQLKLLANV